MRPDSPSETHHIEFRYGSDKEQLTQLMTGKYAYWKASGVREGHEDEYKNSIILFVGENLGAEEKQNKKDYCRKSPFTTSGLFLLTIVQPEKH